MATNNSQQRRSFGPALIGLYLGLISLHALVAYRQLTFELSAFPAYCAAAAGLAAAYALLRDRRWWWRPYVLYCVFGLASNSADEFLNGYGFLAALAYVVFAGALLLAIGLYLRSAMQNNLRVA